MLVPKLLQTSNYRHKSHNSPLLVEDVDPLVISHQSSRTWDIAQYLPMRIPKNLQHLSTTLQLTPGQAVTV